MLTDVLKPNAHVALSVTCATISAELCDTDMADREEEGEDDQGHEGPCPFEDGVRVGEGLGSRCHAPSILISEFGARSARETALVGMVRSVKN